MIFRTRPKTAAINGNINVIMRTLATSSSAVIERVTSGANGPAQSDEIPFTRPNTREPSANILSIAGTGVPSTSKTITGVDANMPDAVANISPISPMPSLRSSYIDSVGGGGVGVGPESVAVALGVSVGVGVAVIWVVGIGLGVGRLGHWGSSHGAAPHRNPKAQPS